MLASIRPQSHTRYLLLPILGAVLDEFTAWSNHRGYALGTICNQLKDSRDQRQLFFLFNDNYFSRFHTV